MRQESWWTERWQPGATPAPDFSTAREGATYRVEPSLWYSCEREEILEHLGAMAAVPRATFYLMLEAQDLELVGGLARGGAPNLLLTMRTSTLRDTDTRRFVDIVTRCRKALVLDPFVPAYLSAALGAKIDRLILCGDIARIPSRRGLEERCDLTAMRRLIAELQGVVPQIHVERLGARPVFGAETCLSPAPDGLDFRLRLADAEGWTPAEWPRDLAERRPLDLRQRRPPRPDMLGHSVAHRALE